MTVVVKLGSSIVAADDGELRTDVLDSVCEQVGALQSAGERVVMVTSGSIARGMRLLELARRPKAMDELQAASAVGQGNLFRAYESRLASQGARAAQVLLTASDIHAREHYLNARQTIERLLSWGVVPVINENDTTATDEITFGDNDFLAAQVAVLLGAELLVLLTNTGGLFTRDPASPEAELIEVVSGPASLEGVEIGAASAFGTGGMGRKIAAAEIASQSGVPVVICDGTRPGSLRGAAAGEPVGTTFVPHPGRASAFKLWLRYAKPSSGSVRVDAGAAARLRESGASLLPVGVVAAEGAFGAGDAVEVLDADGGIVGKGIVNYTRDELREVAGMRTGDVRQRFPDAVDEVIHRDRFVLL